MAKRTYVVGLPVIVTVDDDGTVEYEVDRSEAGQSIREYHTVWTDDDYNDDTLNQDAATVCRDHQERLRRV